MSVTLEIVFSFIIITALYWYWKLANKNKNCYKNIPCPPTVPFLGHALKFTSTKEILRTFHDFAKEYGGIVQIRVGPDVRFLLISDYKLLEFILGTTNILSKSDDYQLLSSWLGTGLLTTDELKWKKHRKILAPSFHFQALEQFIQVFESASNKLVTKLEKELENDSFNMQDYLAFCSLDIICEAVMGVSIEAQDNNDSDYVKSVHKMCELFTERTISVTQKNDFLFKFTRNYATYCKTLKVLLDKSYSVINQRRREIQNKNIATEENSSEATKNKQFLDILLTAQKDGKPLTQLEIREEVDTFLFAGHDTSAAAIGFALYALANHPDIQEKAYEEQKTIFEDDFVRNATYSDLQNMKYLELVIKETLRLYPPVPYTGRRAMKNIQIGEYTIPAGVSLAIFIYGIHRNPEHFPNPEKFDPDRFLKLDLTKPYAYIPFSAGPRNCIGQKFAMLEIKSVISKVLRKFQLLPASPEHKLELLAETVLKSGTGIKMKIRKR